MSRNIGIGEVRTKLLDTDHKQWNCGMGLYDPNKVFFREDPNGKVIVDGKLCIIVRSKSESNLVMISDKFYKFVVIGDQIWLAENLDMPFAGSSYYNNDPAQSYGLLYRGQDMGDLNDYFLENDIGWHVPTIDELNTLITNAGGQSVAGIHLKSTTSWNSGNGDNSTEFDLKAAGLRVGNNFSYKGTDTSLWSCVLLPDSSTAGRMPVDRNNGAYTTTLNWNYGASVRLIKDTDPVIVDGKLYHTAKIGNQIWTIENLDYQVDGAVYYNNDPTDSYGLLYSPTAIESLDGVVEGWHVPYAGELDALSNFVSDNSKLLKSRNTWATNPGTDNYRFAAKAGGSYNSSSFSNKGYYGLFYSQTKNTSNQNYRMNLADNSNTITRGYVNNNNYLSVRLIKDTEPVEIGGRKYKTIRIGNQLWMMENLDYQFEGLNVGGATLQDDVHAWYFNNDATQSEGLLYNGYAAKYLAEHPELLPEGWKVPEPSDFGTLQVAVGGANTAGTYLKNPGTMNGTNYYGFNGLATGMIRSNGSFTDRNTYLRLWTPNMSQTDDTAQLFLTLESDKATATVVSFPNDQNVAYSIRLVKDLSTSNSKGPVDYNVDEKSSKEDTDEKEIDKVDEETKDDSKEEVLKK